MIAAEGVRAAAAALLGEIVEWSPVRGGGNNQLFRARTAAGTWSAVKAYPQTAGDRRDRYAVESAALAFVNRVAPGMVPRLLACDDDVRIVAAEWIDGGPIHAGAASIAQAVAFLAALHAARTAPGAERFGPASEACFSIADVREQLTARRTRLAEVPDLASLLERFDGLADEAFAASDSGGVLDTALRTLSPSDFGFHNALLRGERIVFFDFEYFGWDDPVKTVADFVWHPAMSLDPAAREQFLAGAAALYGADAGYAARLRVRLPLYGLRWALIVLNEFLPERWARRVAAGQTEGRDAILERQLGKAHGFLAKVDQLLREGP